MNPVKIIGDPGSCHMGDFSRAKELTQIAADSGCDAIKWQLFYGADVGPQNIALQYEFFPALVSFGEKLGLEVFASVWDTRGVQALRLCDCKSIKFAYSMQDSALSHSISRQKFDTIYVSGDCNTGFEDGVTKLYCIPEYPVKYLIDFEGIFPRFHGFSSHCLGIEQDMRAIDAGAKIVEKHFQLDDVSHCPDGNFAIRPAQLKALCSYAHNPLSVKI